MLIFHALFPRIQPEKQSQGLSYYRSRYEINPITFQEQFEGGNLFVFVRCSASVPWGLENKKGLQPKHATL
jgi:hypothetical protein